MSYDSDFDPCGYISRRKMVRKVNERIQRFSWSEKEGRLVPDMTGKIVFIDDVTKIIEGKE